MRPIPSVAVLGSHAGIGRSTVATLLSGYLGALGLRVLHLEGAPGTRAVDESAEAHLSWCLEDVCAGRCDLQEAVGQREANVSVVSSRANAREAIDIKHLYSIVRATDALANDTDVLVVDECSGANVHPTILSGAALQAVVVLGDDPDSIVRVAEVIRAMTAQFRMERFYALVNFASSMDAGTRALESLVDHCGAWPLVQVLPIGVILARDARRSRAKRAMVPPEGMAVWVQSVAKQLLAYTPVPSGRIEYFGHWRRA